MSEPLAGQLPTTLYGFEQAAAGRLTPGALDYYAGAGGDGITLRDNEAAWSRIALRPRVLVDVSVIDTTVRVLGTPRAHPLIVAPMAFQRHAHPDGEIATARAAAATAAVLCLSSFSHTPAAEVAAAVPDAPRWFQLYVLRDRGATREAMAAAAAAGYQAVVVTVDRPVLESRISYTRDGFSVVVPPAWPGRPAQPVTTPDLSLIDATVNWTDLEELASSVDLPVIVKGVLSPDDARRAVVAGVAAVVVSNHGGRQLDTVLSGADALGPVVDAVAGAVDVLVDGGIRRGTDIVKALALGADAVLIGRPVLWGLAVGGAAGAIAVLEILLAELRTALALVGVPAAADLDRSSIQPAPWPVS